MAGAGCSLDPKERANPFDPDNPENYGDPLWLTVTVVDTLVGSAVVRRPQLDWRDVDHELLHEYHVYRRRTIFDPEFSQIAVCEPTVSIYTDLEVGYGVRYEYRVVASMSNGADSVLSAVESVYLR